MKFLNGFLIGVVLAGAAGFALGYNHGRGAPLLMNPFEEYTLSDKLEKDVNAFVRELEKNASEMGEDIKQRIHKATE